MKAKWKVYKGASRSLDFAAVSLLRTGILHLNPFAKKQLGKDVRHVELLYDPEGSRIGLRPLLKAEPHARKISQGKHTASVNLKGFLHKYRIQHRKTKRFRATKDEDNIVVIDLKKPL